MTVIYNMSIDRADKPWIGDRRLTESPQGIHDDIHSRAGISTYCGEFARSFQF